MRVLYSVRVDFFGHHIESGKQRTSPIQNIRHDLIGTSDAPEFERQQCPDDGGGGQLLVAGPVGEPLMQSRLLQIPDKEEQSSKPGLPLLFLYIPHMIYPYG